MRLGGLVTAAPTPFVIGDSYLLCAASATLQLAGLPISRFVCLSSMLVVRGCQHALNSSVSAWAVFFLLLPHLCAWPGYLESLRIL